MSRKRHRAAPPLEEEDGFAWWHMPETEWYEATLKHWQTAVSAESDDGVLGGYGSIDSVDTQGSLQFLADWHGDWVCGSPPRPGTRALDCGAGTGRVTEGVLLHAYEQVQLVEVSEALLAKARERLGTEGLACASTAPLSERCEFTADSLRVFVPAEASFDCVWIQWILGHLTDTDVLGLLRRCRAALRPGGAIVVKENNALPSACEQRKLYTLDAANANVIRSHAHHCALFKRAGLRLRRFQLQAGFPAELHAVRMYLLVPEDVAPF